MITAEQARSVTEKQEKRRLLSINKDREFYISLPYKLLMVEKLLEDAIKRGDRFCKIHNEITEEAEEALIKNGYKVKYYNKFIKVMW